MATVRTTWPALIAAVTTWTGAHRGPSAPGSTVRPGQGAGRVPRRADGYLFGHAVRFGTAWRHPAAGEGIETMLSLRQVLPTLPLAPPAEAAHLAGLRFPPGLRRLYIVRDNDRPAGARAEAVVDGTRGSAEGIAALSLAPVLDDFNDDLRQRGPDALAASLQIAARTGRRHATCRNSPSTDRRTEGVRAAAGTGGPCVSALATVCRAAPEAFLRGRSERKPERGNATAWTGYFPPAQDTPTPSARGTRVTPHAANAAGRPRQGAFASRSKIGRPTPSSAALRPPRRGAGASQTKMTDRSSPDREPTPRCIPEPPRS